MSFFDDDDEAFAHTRMSFGDHLEDLRRHLWRAVIGFLIALLISFFLAPWVLDWIAAPVEEQLAAFYENRVQRVEQGLDAGSPNLQELNQPIPLKLSLDAKELTRQLAPAGSQPKSAAGAPGEQVRVTATIDEPLRLVIKLHKALQIVGRRPALSTLSVQEALMAYVKVSLACGLVIGSPWIFWQLWLFVAAGLYPNEKRIVNVYLPFCVLLFVGGVLICQFLVMQKAVQALLWFNQWMGLEPDLRFSEWLTFAIIMPLIFGLSFQLPLVMMVLEKIGIFTVEMYQSHWKIACFLIHVFAAVMVPSADIISMEGLAIPMFGLYGLGILLCKIGSRGSDSDTNSSDREEMVEVS